MSWLSRLKPRPRDGNRRPRTRRARPELQPLESRVVLYSATGNAWPNPAAITISFMPDGTDLGGVTSNLFSTFNNNPALAGRWQAQILQAAQAWAQQTNINLVVVPDNGAPAGAGNNQQGDPGFGDIRIGGYDFGSSSLAGAYQPPPVNNFSLGGDINFNTGQTFNIGTTYDLYTVASHEFGHALGMDHSSTTGLAEMYSTYTSRKAVLNADDISGIRSVYSGGAARSPDALSAAAPITSFAAAANLNGRIEATSLSALVPDLNLNAGQSEYFTFAAPSGTTGSLTVAAQSAGLSLLSPKVTVYAADKVTVLGTAAAAGRYGATATVSVPNVAAGQQFYVKVQGAETTSLGTGLYALGLSFNGTAPPSEASKVVPIANGAVLSTGGGMADTAIDGDDYVSAVPVIRSISPDTGASSSDATTDATQITLSGTAPKFDQVSLYRDGNFIGTTSADRRGNWTFNYAGSSLCDGTYQFTATTTDNHGVVSDPSFAYQVTIDTRAPTDTAIVGVTPSSSGLLGGLQTAAKNPTFFGTAEPGGTVKLYSGSTVLGSTVADRNGNWNFTVGGTGLALGGYAITARATDVAGNAGAATSSFNLSVVSPSLLGNLVSSSSLVSNVSVATGSLLSTIGSLLQVKDTPTLTGRAVAGTQVAILEDSVIVGVATVDLLGNWSFTTPKLTKGTHTFTFADYDQNGNRGAASGSLTIMVC